MSHQNGHGADLLERVFRLIRSQLTLACAKDDARGRGLIIVEQPGPVLPRPDQDLSVNRRIALQVPPVAELRFIAWGPDVLVQVCRRGAGPATDFPLNQLTPEFLSNVVEIFLDGLTPDDVA